MIGGAALRVCNGETLADLFDRLHRDLHRHGRVVRVGQPLQAAAGDIFHGEIAAYAVGGWHCAGVEEPDDVPMPENGQQPRLVQHRAGLAERADPFEHLHRLPAKIFVFHPVHLGERALAQRPVDHQRVRDARAGREQGHRAALHRH
nr:hypothetical protein [Fodinicola feengrottensis]